MNYDELNFNWKGMTREPKRPYPYPYPQDGSEQELAGAGAQEDAKVMLLQTLENNEKRIEELKQEYETLRREQKTSTEDIEHDIAANRAGIGDTAQYNTWRARVEARDASKAAREADDEYLRDTTLRRAKEAVRAASTTLTMARGDYEKEVARQNYESAVADYNDLAKKYGLPPMSETGEKGSEAADNPKKIYLPSDVDEYVRKHTNKSGEWDSRESIEEATRMAYTLNGEEREKYLQAFKVAITEPEAREKEDNKKKKEAKYLAALKEKVKEELIGQGSGEYTISVYGKAVPVTVKNSPSGEMKQAYVNGKLILEWRPEGI